MTSLIRSLLQRQESTRDSALSLAQYQEIFKYGGLTYGAMGNQTLVGNTEEIGASFRGYVDGAYKDNGIVFACITARMRLFSEARFQFQQMRTGRPDALFGTPALASLEKPWPNGTTRDLLARMLLDVDLAGNAYVARLSSTRLTRMRPDWVSIMLGSNRRDWRMGDLDTEVIGYLYHPGGINSGRDPVPLLPENVAHFAPTPDPCASYRGMSWITPIIREVMGDKAAMDHKLRYFDNGATVNLVVSVDPAVKAEAFKQWVATFKAAHDSRMSAYETVFLGGGSTVEAIGSDMQQVDFKVTQGHGETRIAAAAGIPPIVVGLSEGLEAATYSNYGQARRAFADGTMRMLWGGVAGALESIVVVPSGARLWYDARDISFLQEDVKDQADIQQTQAVSIKQLVEAGYEPDSVVKAIEANDYGLLTHTGLFSVQLQAPGTTAPIVEPVPAVSAANGRRLLEQFVGSQ